MTGSGGLAAVGRNVGVCWEKIEAIDRHTERFGADLGDDSEGALSNVDRAHVNGDAPVALQADTHRGWIRQGSVAAAVPHAGDADAATTPGAVFLVECGGFLMRKIPARAQSFEAGANTDALAQDLAGDGRAVVFESVQDSKLEFVYAELVGESIVKLLLRDRALRHTETAEGSGGNNVRVDGAGVCAIMRNFVRSRTVQRNARRDGWPPGSIRAGVEFAL